MFALYLCLTTLLLLNLDKVCISKSQTSVPYSVWNTDVPIRRVLEYHFNVSWFTGAPNGVTKQILGVNGQFPGPTIRGTKGDLVRIHVTNSIEPKTKLSIHWHGMHQKESAFMDGVEHVSQCPLVYSKTQTYEFQLLQTGTHWWHSHYRTYLADGLWGLIIVDNDPEVWGHLYEDELMITLTEWFVKTSEEITAWYLSPSNPGLSFAFPHSLLINGQGYYPCKYAERQGLQCVQKPRAPILFEVVQGNTYRIRLMTAASGWHFKFSIENHKLACIEADGVDTDIGASVDWVRLPMAMRYSFLVKMDAKGASVGSEFLIRAQGIVPANFNSTNNLYPPYDADPEQINAYAILRYVERTNSSSTVSNNPRPRPNHTWTAQDESRTNLDLKTSVQFVESLHCLVQDNDLAPDHFDEEIQITFDGYRRQNGSYFWTTNGVQYSDVEGQVPAIFKALWNKSQPDYANALYTSGNGSIVQLVINNRHFNGHPIHLHGHHFWVVGSGKEGDGDYSAAKFSHLLRTKVTKRDSTRFQARSWMVLRYVADNPGVWLFHCHVTWHLPAGMGAIIIEGQDILRSRFREVPKDAREICVQAGIMDTDSNNKDLQRTASKASLKFFISTANIHAFLLIQFIRYFA